MDDPTWFGDVLPRALCATFVPGCMYDVEEWVIAMGVPISTAIAGGLIFPKWRHVLFVGFSCFVLFLVCQQLRYYFQYGHLSLPFGGGFAGIGLPAMLAQFGALFSSIMVVVATIAHGVKRFALWAGARMMTPQAS